jgi:hypothetical protein
MRSKLIEKECEHKSYCNCNENHLCCEKCQWFRMIDSGFGHCIALPKIETVQWCRIICSLFKESAYAE